MLASSSRTGGHTCAPKDWPIAVQKSAYCWSRLILRPRRIVLSAQLVLENSSLRASVSLSRQYPLSDPPRNHALGGNTPTNSGNRLRVVSPLPLPPAPGSSACCGIAWLVGQLTITLAVVAIVMKYCRPGEATSDCARGRHHHWTQRLVEQGRPSPAPRLPPPLCPPPSASVSSSPKALSPQSLSVSPGRVA